MLLWSTRAGVTSVVDCSYATIQATEPFPENPDRDRR